MKTAIEIFEDIKLLSKNTEFIPTGFLKLDTELDGGFMKKELVVLGGYTGAGKSFIAGQMMFHAAKQGFKCAYFSLEISNEMIVSRLVGSEVNIKPTRIMAGLLTKDEYDLKLEGQATVATYNDQMYFIDDKYYLQEILALIRGTTFDLVVIDFIQNVIEKGDEYEKLSKVALEFQKLAKERNCCMVILSQLSNDAHKSGALEYKGSGSIATVCDIGLFVVKAENEIDKLSLLVKKNRRGRSGILLELKSDYPGGKISEL